MFEKKSLRPRPLVTNPPRQNSKRGGICKCECRRSKKSLCSRLGRVQDASLNQSHEDGLVMIDSGASVFVCPTWFVLSSFKKPDWSVRLRSTDARTLQDYGKRRICLKIENHLKPYGFHVVDMTKPIQSASFLRDNGIETQLARQPFFKHGERHQPFVKQSYLCFVKAKTWRQGCSRGCDASQCSATFTCKT